MAYFHTTVLDNQIKALPTVSTASGSVATFDTDLTENLVECVCDIQYSQAEGTPTPDNPIPITVYNALNLSHSGADTSTPTITNIPFGQTVAKGTLDVTTGELTITHGYAAFDGTENWSAYATYANHYQITLPNVLSNNNQSDEIINSYSSHFTGRPRFANNNASITEGVFSADGSRIRFKKTDCADLTEWVSFVTTQYNNGTPVQVVYKLTTPIDIQLDSTQITALLNENNIWHDCGGDTSVKYLLSVGKKIS